MRNLNRFGLAAGLAAALGFQGIAKAQSPGQATGQDTGTQPGSTTRSQETTQREQPGAATGTQAQRSGQQPQVDEDLAKELQKLHAANQAEVRMAGMVEQKAQATEVKEYARKLANDHRQLDEKLVSQASTLGVNLEGKEYQKAYRGAEKDMKKLDGKSGTSFDKEFMSMAVKDHKKDMKQVQRAAKEARKQNQAALAQFLDGADAGMQAHLDEAERIKDQVEKAGTQRQGRRGARD